mmetsp:Transcript_12547/g.37692  ORF Transcript_12547/g.37692 Transcript_12547/m.37692 type:complete len:83 (-) Transcript_12547:36-284(-)
MTFGPAIRKKGSADVSSWYRAALAEACGKISIVDVARRRGRQPQGSAVQRKCASQYDLGHELSCLSAVRAASKLYNTTRETD